MRNRNRSNLGRYGQHFTPRPEDDVAVLNTSRLANGVQPINYRVVDIEEGLVGINRGGLKVDDRNAYHYSGLPEGGNTYDQLGHVRFANAGFQPVPDQQKRLCRLAVWLSERVLWHPQRSPVWPWHSQCRVPLPE